MPRRELCTFCVQEFGGPELPPADEHHAACCGDGKGGLEAGQVVDELWRGELDLAGLRRERIRESRPERAEVDPVGMGLEQSEREAARPFAERVAAMTGTQEEIEEPLLGGPVAEGRDDLVRVAAVDRGFRIGDRLRHPSGDRRARERIGIGGCSEPCSDRSEPDEDLELRGRPRLALEHGWREIRDVTHRQGREREVVVGLLEHGGGRQDHVGVAGRGVEIGVDADHEVELGQQAFEAAGIRGRQRRVAGDREQRAHLPVAGRVDLVGERRHRQLAEHLREAAHPAVPATRS